MTRRWVRALVITMTLLVGASTAAVMTTQTAWFRNWLRGYIVKQAGRALNGQLSIGSLGGNLFGGVELENVVLAVDGREAVSIAKLGVSYNAFQLLTRGITIDQLRLERPIVHLWRAGDSWELARLVKKEEREADRSGPGRPIAVDQIGIVNGSIFIEDLPEARAMRIPSRFEMFDADLAFHYEPVRYSVDISRLSFRGSDPELALKALSGSIAVRNDTLYVNRMAVRTAESSLTLDGSVEQYLRTPTLKLKAASEQISLPEMARLVPALSRRPLAPTFELSLDGPLSHLKVALDARAAASDVSGRMVADLDGPQQSLVGDFVLHHLDLGPILADKAWTSDVSAKTHADLRAAALNRFDTWKGTVTFTAPHVSAVGLAGDDVSGSARFAGGDVTIDTRAAAYGANVTAAGRLMPPRGHSPFSYELRGRVRGVNLERLPAELKVPPANTMLNAEYHVVGSGSQSVDVDATVLDSTVAEGRIAAPSAASFTLRGQDIGYTADATIANVDLQRVGQAFGVRALDDVRYKSALNGHVVVKGGNTAAGPEITATAMLAASSLAAGRIDNMTLDTTLAADTLRVKASGAFADVDPGAISGKPAAAGKVAGTLDVEATATGISRGLSIESVEAAGRVGLVRSTLGGLSIDSAQVDGTYRDASAEIRELTVHGPDANLQAKGTLALNDTGQSNLVVQADTPSLEAITRLFGQKASGIAKADATITGNRRDLRAAGTLTANDLEFRGQSALQLASDFKIQARDLAFAHAQVSADTKATFAGVWGQNINEVTAKTQYCDKTLEFDVAAKQPQRTLSAGGSLTINPDQQQVSLTRLALQTQNIEWQTTPEARAEIRYGNGGISVQGLRLVSGNQEIAVGGSFGRPEGSLIANARNVSLSTIDALMLRPPMLSGTLNASAEISGTSEAPKVAGRFDVTEGAFRQVHFNSFAGTVDYERSGITVDAKLEQSPANWLEAKGYVPVAAFKKSAEPGGATHLAASSKADSFDLHVNSTAIDLGLAQGVTTALTNVSGTVQANIDVTGPAGDPHPGGTVTVKNGALTVVPTGVTYTNLNGRIELEPDRIHIADIEVLDNDKQPLSIVGDLAIHEQQLGGVNVSVTARNFKIIKNKIGDLRMDSDLLITGDMLRPRIEGEMGVTSGVINLDPLIESVTGTGGATAPTAYTTRGGGRGRSSTSAAGDAARPVDPALAERINAPEGSPAGNVPIASNAGATPDAQPPSPTPVTRQGREGGFSALRMDVHLAVANDFVVRSNDLSVPDAPIGLGAVNVTIGGDLRLLKNPGRDVVRLVGTVNTVRGTYDFQGRRFTILRDGTIRFEGGRDIDPDLSVTAQRAIQGVLANVNVRGTLKSPELVLSSVPPLEQSEILSLIVFNQPINQLGEGQQVAVAQRAQQLAAGALASTLTNSLGKALNLTEFTIQAGTDSGTAAQITAGEQVNENLYAKVEQGFGDASTTNFVLEYEIAKWLRLRTNWLQGSNAQPLLFQRTQDSGLDLLFTFSR